MSEKLELILPEELPIAMLGPNLIVSPLEVQISEKTKSGIIIPGNNEIVNPTTGARFDLNKGKAYANRANELYTEAFEHPFQAIVVAVSKIAEERGYKVGDLIYTDTITYTSRRVLKINGNIYVEVGVDSAIAVVHNFKLEKMKEINSIFLNGVSPNNK